MTIAATNWRARAAASILAAHLYECVTVAASADLIEKSFGELDRDVRNEWGRRALAIIDFYVATPLEPLPDTRDDHLFSFAAAQARRQFRVTPKEGA